jgi:DNA-binding transcriptional ArsR family regulator
MNSDEATNVFDALSSETARSILVFLHTEPSPPSQIGEELDISLQNVRYHIRKLEQAELVEIVDTWYSSRGNEMDVYAPTDAAVVLFAAPEETQPGLKYALTRLLGAIGILGVVSLLLDWGMRALELELVRKVSKSGESGVSSPNGFGQAAELVAELMTPGMVFFTGGVLVLILAFGWWYRTDHLTKLM